MTTPSIDQSAAAHSLPLQPPIGAQAEAARAGAARRAALVLAPDFSDRLTCLAVQRIGHAPFDRRLPGTGAPARGRGAGIIQ